MYYYSSYLGLSPVHLRGLTKEIQIRKGNLCAAGKQLVHFIQPAFEEQKLTADVSQAAEPSPEKCPSKILPKLRQCFLFKGKGAPDTIIPRLHRKWKQDF